MATIPFSQFIKQQKKPVIRPSGFVGPIKDGSVALPQKDEVRVVKFKDWLGGGSYTTGPDKNKVYKQERGYAGVLTRPDYQRDHHFPVSLGGTSEKDNIQLKPLSTAKQKDKVLEHANKEYKAGRISLAQARLMVTNWDNTDIPGQKAVNKRFGGPQNVTSNFVKALTVDPLDKLATKVVNFLEPIAERGGSIIRSAQIKSLTPLKESLNEMQKRLVIQPGDSKEVAIQKATNFALMGSLDTGAKLTKPTLATSTRTSTADVNFGRKPTLESSTKLPQAPQLQSYKQAIPTQGKSINIIRPNSKLLPKENTSYEQSITKPIFSSQGAKKAFKRFDIGNPGETPPKQGNFSPLTSGSEQLKDISGFKANTRDVYRNFKAVFGNKFNEAKKAILDPFDAAKGRYVDEQRRLLDDLSENIVKKLKINKGSDESAAVMDYGEKLVSKDDLIKRFGEKRTNDIVEADKWFRSKYDQLLEEVNSVRKEIYPNNPTKLIPKRQDYYRHFTELSNGLEGLKNLFETPSGISPTLSGISPFTKPRSKFLSFAQARLGKSSDRDAVGGFLNYVPTAAYAKHIDPQIGKFRGLAKELAESTENTKNVNNFVEFLHDYANDLAGKTNPADRYIQKVIPGGRTSFKVIDWLNNRVKANAILGNASSSIAQIFNVPQGIASAKQHSAKGLVRTLGQIFAGNGAMKKSAFVKERYSRSMYNQFDRGILDNTKKFAAWMTGVLDEVGTKFIWNSHYEKALAEGLENPIKYADDTTRALVAGRGIGEVPLIQKSKIFQLFAPFQLEVGNLWHVMGDQVKSKDFGGLAILFAANYLLNRAAEQIRGSDVSFDPINAVVDGIRTIQAEEDKKTGAGKAGGRLVGEVLSNVPGGQTIASMYPEYGGEVLGMKIPPRKELFGKGDPTRFGGGLLVAKAFSDPLSKIAPGFGGVQLKKTYEGLKSLKKAQVENKAGMKLFNFEKSPQNVIRSVLFGQYSTPEARQYFDQRDNPTKSELQKAQEQKSTKAKDEKKSFRPKFEEIQEVKRTQGQGAADQLYFSLPPNERDVYDKLKAAQKTKETKEAEERLFPTFQRLRKMVEEGRKAEADAEYFKLSEEDRRVYDILKKRFVQ